MPLHGRVPNGSIVVARFVCAAGVLVAVLSLAANGCSSSGRQKDGSYPVSCLAVSNDGMTLAIGGGPFPKTREDGKGLVVLWDLKANTRTAEFNDFQGPVRDIGFINDSTLVTGGTSHRRQGKGAPIVQGDVRIWNLRTKEQVKPPIGEFQLFHSMAVSREGKYVTVGRGRGTVSVFETKRWKPIKETGFSEWTPSLLAFASDNSRVFAAAYDQAGQIARKNKVWFIKLGEEWPSELHQEHTDIISGLVVTDDSRYIVTASWDKEIVVWDWSSRKVHARLRGHSDKIWSLALSRDGLLLASGGRNGEIMLWEIGKECKRRCVFPQQDAGITALAFTPDGKHLAGAISDYQTRGEVRLWDVMNQTEVSRIVFKPSGEMH